MHGVSVERIDGALVVAASGELDAFSAGDLESALGESTEVRHLVVDLGSVSFLDSTALGVVVRAFREATGAGVVTSIVLPRSAARRIFEITTLDKVLPVAESREAALAHSSS